MNIKNLLFLVLISGVLNGQSTIIPSWTKIETSNIGNAEAWGINVDETGEIFWTTSVEIDEIGYDLKAYKFDSDGNSLWDTPFLYQDQGTQQAYINVSNETDLYIGGRNCPFLINSCDMQLLKVDKDTKEIDWVKTLNFSGDGYDEIDAIYLGDDGIYCGGWAQEFQSAAFQTDMGLWKLDYDGNTLWKNHFGKPNSAEHIDGHFVVDEDQIYAAGLWNGTGIANLYNGHAFLGTFSKTDGSLLDSVLFGSQSDEFLDIENALGMTSDGEFLYITGYSTPTPDNWQLFIAKYDKQLNQIWYSDWGGEGTETGRGIRIKDNIIYIAGLSESESIISNDAERKGVLITANLDGEFQDYQIWGEKQKTNFHDLDVFDDDIYITGTAEDNDKKEGVLIALTNKISSTSINLDKLKFNVFPNPANGLVRVEGLNFQDQTSKYAITDQLGRIIKQGSISELESGVVLTLNGIYYVTISDEIQSVTRKVMNWH